MLLSRGRGDSWAKFIAAEFIPDRDHSVVTDSSQDCPRCAFCDQHDRRVGVPGRDGGSCDRFDDPLVTKPGPLLSISESIAQKPIPQLISRQNSLLAGRRGPCGDPSVWFAKGRQFWSEIRHSRAEQ
jgi:hypothetical protein